jgi:putative FmdB family regulatory protein
MPIYEYSCSGCGQSFELLIMNSEKPECPECGSRRLSKLVSACSVQVASGEVPACPGALPSCSAERCRSGACNPGA